MNDLIINKYPKSCFAESIKSIKTNLKFLTVDKPIKTILVTSSNVGEGKSFVSANLASAYANSGEKVLLVDCDLRRGRQNKIFGISDDQDGLSELLINEGKFNNLVKYISKTSVKNLHLLTCGKCFHNPTVLLESKKIEVIFEVLRNSYDVIILDSAPVNGLTDTPILNRLADTVIIVTRAKKTNFEELANAKRALENVGASIAGVVLNGVDKRENKYNNSYYYY